MIAIRQAALSVFALTAAASGLASPVVVSAAATDRPASTASKLRSGSVTIIDTRTNAVTATVRVGKLPVQLVITPNGKTAYVLNLFSGTVTRLTTGSGVTTGTVRSAAFPLGLAITPGGRTLYISRSSRTSPGSVLPVDARTGVPGRPVRLPATASAGKLTGSVAVVPDGSKILAAEYLTGKRSREGVQPIETVGHRLGRFVQFGRDGYQPDTILVTPDSRTAFVLGHYGNGDRADLLTQVSVAKGEARRSLVLPFAQMAAAMTPDGRLIYLTDSYDNRVTVVRTATDSILYRIPVNSASSLAVSPDGKTVFVGGTDRSTGAPEIVTISTAGNKPSAPILLGDGYGTVNAIAFTPSGRTAYAAIGAAGGHFVVPVNTATRALGPFITVGPNPAAIAIARYGSTMYVLNSNYCC